MCLKVAFFDKLQKFNDIPVWGSYTTETPFLYIMEWKEVNKDTLSLSLGSSAHLKGKKFNQPNPFFCTTFVDHLNQGGFTSGKNETKRRLISKMKINLQFYLMCDLLFFFFLQVLLKLRFLRKKQWKKQNKTKQKQWLKLINTNPIEHIMIKLTSLKQLRRACRKKQTINFSDH